MPSCGADTTRRSRTSLAARRRLADFGLLAAGLVELLTDVGQSGAALGLDIEPGCRGTLARSRHGTAQLGVPCLDCGQLSLQLLRTGARFPALRQKPLRALELTLERGTLPLHGVTLLRRRSCVLLLLLDLARQRADLRLVGQPAGREQFLLPRLPWCALGSNGCRPSATMCPRGSRGQRRPARSGDAGDVLPHGAIEQARVLRQVTQHAAEAGRLAARYLLPVEQDGARARPPEAAKQPRKGRLPGTGGADHTQDLAGRDGEAHAPQDRTCCTDRGEADAICPPPRHPRQSASARSSAAQPRSPQ